MFGWFKRTALKDYLKITKKVKIKGIVFEIRRLNPLDYMNGAEVLVKEFDLYAVGGKSLKERTDFMRTNGDKIKKHWGEVIMAGTVRPEIVRKEDGIHTTIDEVLQDWDLAQDLYMQIMVFTQGKKKVQSKASLKTVYSN